MKTKEIIFKSLFAMAITGLLLGGCRKKEEADEDSQAGSDQSQAEAYSNDAANIADAAAKGTVDYKLAPGYDDLNPLGTCATVSKDSSQKPTYKITVSFGATNCLCKDGRYRRGDIIITHTGNYFASGAKKTVTFNNYYVNDNHVEGTKTITNNGKNSAGHFSWSVDVQNMKITRTDGKFHTWNSQRTREMIAGDSTLTWNDDVYLITGSANGTNINGVTYSANITVALKRALSCKWFLSGTVEITPGSKATRSLDFGNGNCDDDATVTIKGKSFPIKLH